MKRKILSLILVFAMTVSLLTVGTGAVEPTYGDTAGHWAESSIERWSGHGIIQGSNGLFDPNGQLTCAQLATILAKLLKLPAAKDAGFTDNTADAWYYDAINRCAAAGILNGNGDGTVTPEAPISRERAMVMLARALGIEPIRKPDLTKYTDAAQVSAYAQGYVAALIEAGIVGGVTADQLAPQANINRASTVTILDRAISTYADKAGATVKADGKGIVLVVADDVTVTGNVDKLLVPADNVDVTVSGSKNIDDITVTGDNSKVILNNSTANDVTLDGKNTELETKGSSKVENVSVTEDAKGATVNAGSGTTVKNVENSAADTTVTGSGSVKNVASDTDVTVETKGTEVKNTGDGKITVTDKNGKDSAVNSGSSSTTTGGTTSGGSSHSHSYVYTDNGDGTHTGKCYANDSTLAPAAHTYTGGKCTACGAEAENKAASVKDTKGVIHYYDNLTAAITAADDENTVTLLKDVAQGEQIQVVGKAVTLDLAGHKITIDENVTISSGLFYVGNNGDLTINDTSAAKTGMIDVTTDRLDASGYPAVWAAVVIYPSNNNTAKLTVNGGTLQAPFYPISGNGNCKWENATEITINGGKLESTQGLAIYHPQNGTLTVNGGELLGQETAIEIRGGNLTINDGTFTATNTPTNVAPNGNGTTSDGAAIAVAQHTTKLPIQVTINGGVFNAYTTLYESNPQNNSATDIDKVQMSVKNGTFNTTKDGTVVVYAQDCTGFITGGTFSSDPTAYVAEGYVVDENDGTYVVRAAKPGETAKNPILIETASDLKKIKNSGVYTYYKVANNVTEIDCTDVSRLNLYGEFDGNGATLKNLKNSLFHNVGNGKAAAVTTVLKNFTAVMNTPNSLVFNIAGKNTKFEDVKVSGYMEGYWNMGAFVNYGSKNSDDEGFDYMVEFANCSCDATIISKQNSSAAVLVGYPYPGDGHQATIKLDSATNAGIESATMRINGSKNGYKYYGLGSAVVYLDNSTTENTKLPESKVTQLDVVNPTKSGEGNYTVTVQEGATAKAQLTAQLTSYKNDGSMNLRGITFTLGASTSVENGNVFGKIERVEIVNETTASGRPEYTLDGTTLKVYTNTTENYATGTVSVKVSQYDTDNKLCAIGSLVLAEKDATDAEQWTIR